MALDVATVRSHFPALAAGAAHFDGPGGSQTPDVVADAVARHAGVGDREPRQRHGRRAHRRGPSFATRGRRWPTCSPPSPTGIVFGRSMTQLTFDLARTLANSWRPGDEVVVTRLDHDANVRPWVIAAERAGATVRFVDFDPDTAELTPAHVAEQLSARTRLVAVTGASNLLGTRPDLVTIADLVHDAGALLFVDGVHLTAHASVDIARARRRPVRLLAVQVLRTALRRAGGRPGPARAAAPRQAGCRPATPCPSGSSSARCRTS